MFWFDNILIIFEKLDEFYPTFNMQIDEKLNAIFRLSIYLGIILSLILKNYRYLYIPIFIGIFTIFIYKTQKENLEYFFDEYDKLNCSDVITVKPTADNPFMNFNNITDDRNRAPGTKTYNNPIISNEVEDKFKTGLYQDVGDLYSKSNGQLVFYQMPSTTAANDQTAFAKFLFNTGPTCKEDTIKCASPWSPIDTSQLSGQFVNPS